MDGFLPVISWCKSGGISKYLDEIAYIAESGLLSHFIDPEVGIAQQHFYMLQPLFLQIVGKGRAGFLFEFGGKVIGRNVEDLRQRQQIKIAVTIVFLDCLQRRMDKWIGIVTKLMEMHLAELTQVL